MEPEESVHVSIPEYLGEMSEDVERMVPGSFESTEPRLRRHLAPRRPNASLPLGVNPALCQLSATIAAETPSGVKNWQTSAKAILDQPTPL